MKSYNFNLVEQKTYTRPFLHTCETKYAAEIRLRDDTTFSELIQQMERVKEIFKIAQKAIKDHRYFEFEITESIYRWDDNDNYRSLSFNRWVSVPEQDQDETGGIYFRPDTKYTSENRDMYLASLKTLFDDLAFTLR